LGEEEVGLAVPGAGTVVGAAAVEFPVPEGEDEDVGEPDGDRREEKGAAVKVDAADEGAALEEGLDEEDEGAEVGEVDQGDEGEGGEALPGGLVGAAERGRRRARPRAGTIQVGPTVRRSGRRA
jgi:hypothetical protein